VKARPGLLDSSIPIAGVHSSPILEDPVIDPEASAAQPREYGADVHVVAREGREFVLVGTAHISRESVGLVREVIENEQPDRVCIELDSRRYQALSGQQRFESLDLKQVIRTKQLATLMLNLVLVAYQKHLGLQLGVQPGTELLEAARTAEEHGIPVALCDRDIRVTLRRAWQALPWFRKILLLSTFLGGIFERPQLSEEDLRELRQQDVLSRLMQEVGEAFPGLKTVLIDERDSYLSERIREAAGRRIVAVVGAGHVEGMRRALAEGHRADLEALDTIPPVSRLWKWVGWGIPAVILGSLLLIGLRQGASAAGENLLFWIFVNAIPSALGAMAALAHPLTIAAAFLAAPITSLTPVIGAGYVAAFVQSYFKPPLVSELKEVSREIGSLPGWWRNRLLRIFLVFLFTTLGSILGTWVGGAEIVSNLF
jgi:pheromone shutdown-related protein TraB